jgi:hypothetical protein
VKKLLFCLLAALLVLILLTLQLRQQKNLQSEKVTPKDQSPAEKSPDLKYYDGDDVNPYFEDRQGITDP